MDKEPGGNLEEQKEWAIKALAEVAMVDRRRLGEKVTDLKSLAMKLVETNVLNGFYDVKQGKATSGPFVGLRFSPVGAGAASNWGDDKISFGTPEKGIDCYIAVAKNQLVLFYYEHAKPNS
jgi:hypothetical protein